MPRQQWSPNFAGGDNSVTLGFAAVPPGSEVARNYHTGPQPVTKWKQPHRTYRVDVKRARPDWSIDFPGV